MDGLAEIVVSLTRFAFATVTSHFIGEQLGRRAGFPQLTGYILGGFISGPWGIHLVELETLHRLSFINGVALAVIAFCAGAELYLPDIRPHLRTIITQMTFIVAMTLAWCACTVMIIRKWVPYMSTAELPCQWQIALLCASIMIARSPSSAMALIQESFAKGPITSMCMGITVVSDAALLVAFAVMSSLASAECLGQGIDSWAFVSLGVSVFGSIVAGYVLGRLIVAILWIPLSSSYIKGGIIISIGYAVFYLARVVERASWSRFGHRFRIEPLLVCMVASCAACNATSKRRSLTSILHNSSLYVFLPFFTLTGASLRVENTGPVLPLSIILFSSRMIAIWMGSQIALKSTPLGEFGKQYPYLWMTLTTQAGAAIGLANELAFSFKPWGTSFADAITMVVVLNQVVGPFIFRFALQRVGEDRSPKHWQGQDVAVLGANRIAMSISARLCRAGCRVRVVRSDDVSEAVAKMRIDQVLASLASEEKDANAVFHLRLMTESLPANLGQLTSSCGTNRHHVDLDYCPPLSPSPDGAHDSKSAPLLCQDHWELSTLVQRLIPEQCATVVVALDTDAQTAKACDLITSSCPHIIPRIVAIAEREETIAQLCSYGIIVVNSHTSLAEVASALALTHSSQAVSILAAGKFSVHAARSLIKPIDVSAGPASGPASIGGAVEGQPVHKLTLRLQPRPEMMFSPDDWAVPMTTKAGADPVPVAHESNWKHADRQRRRRGHSPAPRWMSLS